MKKRRKVSDVARLYFKKLPGGYLAPADDEAAEWLQKIKTGDAVAGEFVRPRNYKFHRKLMALYGVCFDYFTEQHEWNVQYRGMKVEPSFDMFRKQLTILAGHYTASFDIRGNVKLEAKSLSFANCTEEEVEKIFQDVITAALRQVFKFQISEEQLRKTVDDILAFA